MVAAVEEKEGQGQSDNPWQNRSIGLAPISDVLRETPDDKPLQHRRTLLS